MSAGRGAYIDHKGVRWDANNADYEGFLSKKSRWMGEWRKRYFILKGSKLFFAKSPMAAPHGLIDLVECTDIKIPESKSKLNCAIELFLKREQFHLTAQSGREKDEWLGQLRKVVSKHTTNVFEDYHAHAE